MVLQSQLNCCLVRLFVITHQEVHWDRARASPTISVSEYFEQRVLVTLFGEADVRGDSRVYCFTAGQSFLSMRQRKEVYALRFRADKKNVYYGYPTYYISGMTQSARDRFASWLRYRCEQQIATVSEVHAHGNTTEVIGGDTSDL
jgi:hypothetical protein